MAIVLSNQENMDLLLFLGKLAIALGAIAIAMLLIVWLHLKKLEKRLYWSRNQLSRKQLKPKFAPRKIKQTPQPLKKPPNRSLNFRWRWLMAIASITGIAFAVMQLSNNFVSPEFMPLIWLLIGVTLVVSASLS